MNTLIHLPFIHITTITSPGLQWLTPRVAVLRGGSTPELELCMGRLKVYLTPGRPQLT